MNEKFITINKKNYSNFTIIYFSLKNLNIIPNLLLIVENNSH